MNGGLCNHRRVSRARFCFVGFQIQLRAETLPDLAATSRKGCEFWIFPCNWPVLPKAPGVTVAAALAYLQSLQQFGFKPGLETTHRLAALVGAPQERLSFIHVAGTNGKGSVCALLESVYRASGRRVGLYTSPHLVRFGERIQINRQSLPDRELAQLTAALKEIVEQENEQHPERPLIPTFFEFTTLLALQWFAEQGVDLVIWETGLGGRWDATNIVAPVASVITNIALDHQRVLGNTTAAIAAEKAGIIKAGTPILTATDDPDARAVIEGRARELGAPLLWIGPTEVANFRLPLGLLGGHQRVNGALAAATVQCLQASFPVSGEDLAAGFANVRWAGRLQRLERGQQTLLLDGAHNPAGVAALKVALAQHFPGRQPTLLIGMLADKDWAAMVATLAPLAGRIVTCPVASPRTVSAEDLRAACLATGLARPVQTVASAAEGLKACADDAFVVVTGSLYFIGEVLELLNTNSPPAASDPVQRRLNEWTPPGSASGPSTSK